MAGEKDPIIAKEGKWTLERGGRSVSIRHDCGFGWRYDENRLPLASNECGIRPRGPICRDCKEQAPAAIEAMYHVAKMCIQETWNSFSVTITDSGGGIVTCNSISWDGTDTLGCSKDKS